MCPIGAACGLRGRPDRHRREAGGAGSGHFYEPTLITGATQDSEIVQKEIFGPVLPILKWDDYEQAVSVPGSECTRSARPGRGLSSDRLTQPR